MTIANTTFAATQSGTWTVQPGNTANTTAWLVTGTGGTFPITAGSLPLPTGASTSALQPTNAAQGSTTSGQTGHLVLGAVTTGAPTYTTAQTSPLSLDTAGNLRVNVVVGGGSGGTSSTFGSVFPTIGTAIGLNNGTNMVAWSASSNYGTAPAAIAVPAVNAFITNTNANGQAPAANSSPVVLPALQVAANTIGSTTSGQNGNLVQGAVTTANPSYTTAQTNPVSMDVKGNTRVVLGGGVPETASATGTTAATTATLATSVSTTTYICGFSIRANATAAATGNATVTGVITGTMNFTQWTAPLATGLGVTEETFTPCIPASAANTSIAVVSAAPGTGGVVSVSAWGYQQ
jgi:hypothetical protein